MIKKGKNLERKSLAELKRGLNNISNLKEPNLFQKIFIGFGILITIIKAKVEEIIEINRIIDYENQVSRELKIRWGRPRFGSRFGYRAFKIEGRLAGKENRSLKYVKVRHLKKRDK